MTGFYSWHETDKNFKSLYGLWARCLKLETFVWILNHNSRSITLSLFTLKASYLVKWPFNLNMIFHVVISVYRLIKIWNSPQFPAEFRNSQWVNEISFTEHNRETGIDCKQINRHGNVCWWCKQKKLFRNIVNYLQHCEDRVTWMPDIGTAEYFVVNSFNGN